MSAQDLGGACCDTCGARDAALNERGECVHCERAILEADAAAADAALASVAAVLDAALRCVHPDDLRELVEERIAEKLADRAYGTPATSRRELAALQDTNYRRRHAVVAVDDAIADLEQQFRPGGER